MPLCKNQTNILIQESGGKKVSNDGRGAGGQRNNSGDLGIVFESGGKELFP